MSSSPNPRFYTTSYSAERSVAEIQKRLAKYGARAHGVEYENGDPERVYFVAVSEPVGEVPVRLEAPVEPLMKRTGWSREKALKVAWRQMLAYVEMMLEMVESGERPLHEAFMADIALPDGSGGVRRLGDIYAESNGRLALPSGEVIDAEPEIVDE